MSDLKERLTNLETRLASALDDEGAAIVREAHNMLARLWEELAQRRYENGKLRAALTPFGEISRTGIFEPKPKE